MGSFFKYISNWCVSLIHIWIIHVHFPTLSDDLIRRRLTRSVEWVINETRDGAVVLGTVPLRAVNPDCCRVVLSSSPLPAAPGAGRRAVMPFNEKASLFTHLEIFSLLAKYRPKLVRGREVDCFIAQSLLGDFLFFSPKWEIDFTFSVPAFVVCLHASHLLCGLEDVAGDSGLGGTLYRWLRRLCLTA